MKSSTRARGRLTKLLSHRNLPAFPAFLAVQHFVLRPLRYAWHSGLPGVHLLFLVSFVALGLSTASLSISILYRHLFKQPA